MGKTRFEILDIEQKKEYEEAWKNGDRVKLLEMLEEIEGEDRKRGFKISFNCGHCGIGVIAYIRGDKLTFSILDKLYSSSDVLSYNGYYVCIQCREKSNHIKIQKWE